MITELIHWHLISNPPDNDREVMVIDEDGECCLSICEFVTLDRDGIDIEGRSWFNAETGQPIEWPTLRFWAELPKGPAGPYAVKITADGFEVRNRPTGKPFAIEQDAKKAIQLAQQLNCGDAFKKNEKPARDQACADVTGSVGPDSGSPAEAQVPMRAPFPIGTGVENGKPAQDPAGASRDGFGGPSELLHGDRNSLNAAQNSTPAPCAPAHGDPSQAGVKLGRELLADQMRREVIANRTEGAA